jgi:anti-anti-sigma factor
MHVSSLVSSPADRKVRITVDEVDRSSIGRFAGELQRHRPGAYCLVVDLRDVAFLDASGARVLAEVAEAMWAAGGAIALVNARSTVRRVLDVLDLNHLLAAH